MAYGKDDRGIGGWLAFFLVTLGIVTPAFGLRELVQELNDPLAQLAFRQWPALKTTEIGLVVGQTTLCWFLCYRFLRVFNWTTVRLGVAGLVLLGIVAVVVQPLLVAGLTGLGVGMVYQTIGANLVRPIVYSVLWSSYLLVSKRVRATYCDTATRVEIDAVFD